MGPIIILCRIYVVLCQDTLWVSLSGHQGQFKQVRSSQIELDTF